MYLQQAVRLDVSNHLAKMAVPAQQMDLEATSVPALAIQQIMANPMATKPTTTAII
jgi:hypothetical protein